MSIHLDMKNMRCRATRFTTICDFCGKTVAHVRNCSAKVKYKKLQESLTPEIFDAIWNGDDDEEDDDI